MPRFAAAALLGVIVALAGVRGDARLEGAGQNQQPNAQQPSDAQQKPDVQQPGNPQQTGDPQQPSSSQQPPTFRAGVNFVRVDVIVTDKSGKPIDDLKREDFEVTEGGKRQTIETFKLVSLDGGLMPGPNGPPAPIRNDADEEVEAARDDVRLFGVFLDDYHVKKDSSVVMRQQLARFVETQLGPSDMIGLMYPLDPLDAVRMTRNHDAVMRGVQQFEGRKDDYTPRNAAEEQYAYRASAETIERIRNQASFSGLKALILRMGGLKEGRKALILVSEGYSNILPPQLRSQPGGALGGTLTPLDPTLPDPALGNDFADVTRQVFASMDINMELREIYDLANRNNVAIYAVDPRGLATSEFGVDLPAVPSRTDAQYLNNTMDTLRVLAENSDGRAILNRNDLAIAMKQIVVDTSAYYLLGYNSTVAAPDGKFHEIDVKVKRSGVQVRHRKGYWALKPEEATRTTAAPAAPSPVATALAATATPRSRVIRTWIGSQRAENGQTRVTFVWEPMPKLPGETVRESDRPIRVNVTAVSPDGPQYFRGPVPATASAAQTAGSRVTFEAPPGRMQLRLSVEGAGSEVLDTEVRDVTVPDLTSAQTLFGTPEVFRARTLPELQRLKSDPQSVPVAAREFSRTERLLIRVSAYGPGGTMPKLTARLLNRAGQSILELPIAMPDSRAAVGQIEVSLANIPAGEYAVEITATGEGGDAKELVAFRVTP